MTPRKLYVIGNGFDLWHGIPSSYSDFRTYARLNAPEVFRAVESYLPAGKTWGYLEAALAEIDVDYVLESHGHFLASYGDDDWRDSAHHDFQYEVEQVVERLSDKLQVVFCEWIRQLPIPTAATAPRYLRPFEPNSTFLTFNYTKTLREIYGVSDENVLHIHGNAEMQNSDLILGHAWCPENRSSLNDRPDIAELDVRLAEAHNVLDDYFSKTFKPSAQIIQAYLHFFASLCEVKEVFVLGHSLSAVDMPYFNALSSVSGLHVAQWTLAYHDNSEELLRRMSATGVAPSYIRAVPWTALQ